MATVGALDIIIGADVSEFTRAMNTATGRVSAFSDKMTSVGKGLTIGLTAPLVALGVKAVDLASDLDESMSKVGAVFDDQASSIMEWSSTSATAMGISQQAALEAAGTFGNLFVAMGLSREAAADMSPKIIELGADLASFNNLKPEEALEKLRAGLIGEIEPLRALGVSFNAAAVEAEALKLGLINVGQKAGEQDKIMARYSLITQQTALAHGDFAKTSEGVANQLRITKATTADAGAAMGKELLPAVQQVLPVITGLIKAFGDLSPETQKIVVTIGAIGAVAGPALVGLGSAIGLIAPLALKAATAVKAFAAAGIFAKISFGIMGVAIAGIVAGVVTVISHWNEMGIVWRQAVVLLLQGALTLRKGMLDVWAGIKTVAVLAISAIAEIFIKMITSMVDKARTTLGGLSDTFDDWAAGVSAKLSSSKEDISQWAAVSTFEFEKAAESTSAFSDKVTAALSAYGKEMDQIELKNSGLAAGTEKAGDAFAGAAPKIDMAAASLNAFNGAAAASEDDIAAAFEGSAVSIETGMSRSAEAVVVNSGVITQSFKEHITQIPVFAAEAMDQTVEAFDSGWDDIEIRGQAFADELGVLRSNYTDFFGGRSFESLSDFLGATGRGGSIPRLAAGGIVTSPTLAVIGESGPEAVIPLRGGRGGAGGTTIVNVNVAGSVRSENDLIDAVRVGLRRVAQRNVFSGVS